MIIDKNRKGPGIFVEFVTADIQGHFVVLPVQQAADVLVSIFLVKDKFRILVAEAEILPVPGNAEIDKLLQNLIEFRVAQHAGKVTGDSVLLPFLLDENAGFIGFLSGSGRKFVGHNIDYIFSGLFIHGNPVVVTETLAENLQNPMAVHQQTVQHFQFVDPLAGGQLPGDI